MKNASFARRCGLVLAFGLLALAPGAAAPVKENFDFLQTSSVRVVAYYPGQVIGGTGWVTTTADAQQNANNAIIVTAAHVVRGATRVGILEANSANELEATVRAIDSNRDIAFIEVRGLRNGGVPLTVTPMVPPVGQEVRTTGYTRAADRTSRNEVAEISGVLLGAYSRSIPNPQPISSHADVGVAQFQHSIILLPGFSGGPVIDKCGRVVGFNVTDGGHINTPGGSLNLAPGISFAIASTEIIKAAQERSIRLNLDTTPCPDPPPPLPVQNQVDGNQIGQPDGSEDPGFIGWLRAFIVTRTGGATIAGLLGLIAFGIAAWFLLKSPRKRDGDADPVLIEPPTTRPIATAGIVVATSLQTLTLTGRGPKGEAINLRFASDEIASVPRTLGTEGQAHVPDSRTKYLVSRVHAKISYEGRDFFVEDLKSMNGTEVDGSPLPPFEKRRLHNGAIVKLADIVLTARID